MFVKKFIDKPILSGVISVVIVILGLIGLTMLPVEQFPNIAPPTINVTASYTGANASTVQKSVIVPLEEAINGVEDMIYMTSTATNTGAATIKVFFKQGADSDMATVNIQNRITSAMGLLPAEVTKSGVLVRKGNESTVKNFTVFSPDGSFDSDFISNYIRINIEPRISRIAGVANVEPIGASYALRIWLDPHKMAQYSIMPSDIRTILDEQNIEISTGTLGNNTDNAYQYNLRYKGRYETVEEFEKMVVRSLPNGEVLYLNDVANIELGIQDYDIINEVKGVPGRPCKVYSVPGANATEIITEVDALLEEIKKELPKGLDLATIIDEKEFLDASIDNVIWTFIEAILLVILVVYVFLQSLRSTFIPALAIVISLVGTFFFIYLAGFSLNLLTLFALILAIGTVVDDAIVVVEAVQQRFDKGEKSPYVASVYAMKDVSMALVTTTVVFMAVFIPVTFISGTTGTFYTQFGVTMAIAVAISTINALTLSPALCALIMTAHKDVEEGKKTSFSTRFNIAFNASFERVVDKYKRVVTFFINRKWLSVGLLFVAVGGLYFLMNNTKTALIPKEDMGRIFISFRTQVGSTVGETYKVMKQIEERVKTIDEMELYVMFSGQSVIEGNGATNGMFMVRLKDWDERKGDEHAIGAVIKEIYAKTADITQAEIMVTSPPMISGYGISSGFNLYIQDKKGGDVDELFKYTKAFLAALNKRPEIAKATTSFDTKFPQYLFEVDAAQCKRNGVSPADVLSTISGYVGGNYISNINRFSKLYRVIMQAPFESKTKIENLDALFVRGESGEMSPVSQYIKVEKVYGSESLTRFNLFPAIAINGMTDDAFTSGEAIEAVREVAKETLPTGYGYEFSGMSREEAESSGNNTLLVFLICILFVYLILCALYESMFIPLAVILSIPFGLAGSFIFAQIFGTANDIYMQTGLIMLIGLLAKTAILLTEYASQRRAEGLSIKDAAIDAAKVRLRPILMTSLTMVFGMLPLMFATGVGANGNISLGVTIVGGMIIGTLALIFIVPTLYIIFQTIEDRVMPKRDLPKLDL
ncbi:MAG: efflux RND transporter permease subunit [Rikenellaceae bacterium]